MQVWRGQRDRELFHYDGFDYRIDNKKTVSSKEYRCTKRGCPGRAAHSYEEPHRVKTKNHNHARDTTNFRVWKFRKTLKENAAKDLATPLAKIFKNVSRQYADVAELVAPHRERSMMRRVRRKNMPKIPSTYSELGDLLSNNPTIREKFGKSDPLPGEEEREAFFQTSLNGPHGNTLVFASPFMLEKCLMTSAKIKMDATYKALPRKPKGRQLFTIHATHGVNTFPVIFCLMESKKKAAYIQLLEYIKLVLCPLWQPEDITTDFEKSLRKAVKQVFPTSNLIGCYFHFTQAVQKKWSQHGLMKVPKNIEDEAKNLKSSLMSLAFGRVEDIRNIFETIDENVSLALRLRADNFLAYFKKTWLSETDQNFKPEDFSVYGYADRTNNHVESFHSTLQMVHPNIWIFLHELISISIEARQNFGRVMNGLEITERIPAKILWNEERIVQARNLLEAGRINPPQFVMWCRRSTKNTLAVVRQGRRLRRLLRAEEENVEYDDIPTSSDSSVASSASSFDFDFNPNPHRIDEAMVEDREAAMEWQADLNHNREEVARDLEETRDDISSLPPSEDSVWQFSEDEDLQLIHSMDIEVEPPSFETPEQVRASARPPRSCIYCMAELATVVALPCGHALTCNACKQL